MDKKFFIYANDSEKSKALEIKLKKELKEAGCTISSFAKNIIVLGGDGTFVHAYNKYANKDVKMVLINTGFVGFYSLDIEPTAQNIIKFFEDENNFYLPDVIECKNGKKVYYALNEIVVLAANTVSVDTYVNENFYERFWGTGLCFSTKTGSTGYNKSLNGAILLTQAKLWQMCEMAPLAHAKYISLRNSIVLDDKKIITLKNFIHSDWLKLVNDGLENNIDTAEPLSIKLSSLNAKIGFYKGLKSYISKLQKVFLIGEKK